MSTDRPVPQTKSPLAPGSRRAAITARYPVPPRYEPHKDRMPADQPECYAPEEKPKPVSLPPLKTRQRWPHAWRRVGAL